MKVDTYSPNTREKLFTFALSPIVVENHRVAMKKKSGKGGFSCLKVFVDKSVADIYCEQFQ